MKVTEKAAGPRALKLTISALVAGAILAACTEPDTILPGKRESLQSVLDPSVAEREAAPNEARPISLPATTLNSAWTQSPGTPAFRTDHPALNAPVTQIWSANIGSGDSRRQRITASPVVANGVVYTLDSDAGVTATTTSGQTVWERNVRPETDKDGQATGGGIAYHEGRLYVSLGYGSLVAMDATTGQEIWRQALEGTGSGAPTIVNNIVYVTSGDDRGWAVSTEEGRVLWQIIASPDANNVLGAPAPAVADGLAIFAFGSGEVQAVFQRGGLRRWDATVAGLRPGTALGNVGDVTAQPIVSGRTVYVGNQSGRTVALDSQSGARLWTANDGAVGNIVPTGGSVFIINDLNELIRLDNSDGSRIWSVNMPKFVKRRVTRRSEIVAHHGPLLAGGRLYVASNDGQLRAFDPVSGALLSSVEIPGGATSAPVVAGGVLYVVSTKGKLHAFR